MERHVNPEDLDLSALGALDGEEQQAVEAHVRVCPACAQALAAARRRIALLGLAAPAAVPAPAVREALLRRVRAERGERTSGSVRADARTATAPRLAWLTPAFGVAALVFAGLAAAIWMKDLGDNRRIHDLESQLAVAQARSLEMAHATETTDKLLEWPGTRRVALMPMPGMGNGHGGVLYNEKMGMVACAGWLPAPPAGKTYQLWLVPMEGKPMPLHVFGSGEWTEPMAMQIAPGMEAKTFAVTEEPEGGMPWPTGPKVLAGAGE
jgi:anti-sigma-K factor RskA